MRARQKSFEEGSAALQKLLGAKSLENAIEIQTAYTKTAYDGFVAQAARMGEFYVNLAKETSRSFENFVPQAPAAKPTENFVPQAATPKAATPKAPATRSPRPRNKPPPTSPDSETTTRP